VEERIASLLPQPRSPDEAERQRVAELHGDPYLMYRTPDGALQLLSLPGSWDRLAIGRHTSAEISLRWDQEVSTFHAQLERLGDEWALVDDGLSRNGSYVNDERILGRCRLSSGDRLRFGRTPVTYRAPLQVSVGKTITP
jgi:FHA domain